MANKPIRFKQLLHGFNSDASLLAKFAEGDASAFESLYGRYKNQMFNHLCNELGTQRNKQAAAEEIAQDVWMAVIKGAAKFEDRSGARDASFRSWLFSIAHRQLADFWRSQYKQPAMEAHELESEIDASQVFEETHTLEQARLMQELMQGINELPLEQRQSFLLREEGFSYREIAEITEANEETVKSRLRYSKKTLKTRMNPDRQQGEQLDEMEHQYDRPI